VDQVPLGDRPELAGWAGSFRRYSPVATFVAGFLFDLLTMQRIDAWTDLAFQLAYLVLLTGLLVYQQREATGTWVATGLTAKWWRYNVDALHFLYGGLLSAYVVLYVRSSTGTSAITFLVLLVGVMVLNEVPPLRQAGHALRLGLYGFCVLSFLNYFIPIVVGRIAWWVFLLSLLLSAAVVWRVAALLVPKDEGWRTKRTWLFAPAGGVLLLIGVLYVLRLIPPVPLSVQFQGIYHDVRRDGHGFTLVYERPRTLTFWRHDSRPFARRPGDRVHYFTRVFAPAGFQHRVVIRWEVQDPTYRTWMTSDLIPLEVSGGRAEGFRGTAVKANFTSGNWRVTAETDDGRAIARLSFRVDEDTGTGERVWDTTRF
jgi:hypothetical protein